MNEHPKTDTSMTGKLKRLAADILDLNKPDSSLAATMPPAEPLGGLGGVGNAVRHPDPIEQCGEAAGLPSPFQQFKPYALAVAPKETSRGYGKKAGSGNKNLIYVTAPEWEGVAVCRVTDREQWRAHDRLEGVFSRITPDGAAEFAYLPGRRAGR
jgi:hypothetical protein